MAGVSFDPKGAVRFDLRNGAASDARGERLVLVPSTVFQELSESSLTALGTSIGRACGARVANRLGGGEAVLGASLDDVVSHLAGELALAGVCSLEVERWGRAMLAVVKNEAVAADAFLCALLASAISEAAGRSVFATFIGRDALLSRFFIGSHKAAQRVRGLVAEGRSYGDIVAMLQGSTS